MTAWPLFILFPALGALIGWGTNVVAIRMLFHPRHPWRMPLTGWVFQGLIPKRQKDLANAIADTITQELLTIDDMLERIDSPERRRDIVDVVVKYAGKQIREWLDKYFPPAIAGLVLQSLGSQLEAMVQSQTEKIINAAVEPIKQALKDDLDLRDMIITKITSFDLTYLEGLVWRVAKNEFRYIEIMGGLLGFVIGLVQALVANLMPTG
ncbi:MAG TPA: DUF445 family protein [Firmicutes bacterium]|nr:DUF445 family protein [Bacillota bacterium]